MKRTPFKRRAPAYVPRDPDRVRHTPAAVPAAFRVAQPVTAACEVSPKADPVRSEAYRRAVASLPCVICGIYGFSQAAHANTGKGMGMKACDLTLFPACCARPGEEGCHARLDQGALYPKHVRRALEPVWAADTQRKVRAMGLWPQEITYPFEETES